MLVDNHNLKQVSDDPGGSITGGGSSLIAAFNFTHSLREFSAFRLLVKTLFPLRPPTLWQFPKKHDTFLPLYPCSSPIKVYRTAVPEP